MYAHICSMFFGSWNPSFDDHENDLDRKMIKKKMTMICGVNPSVFWSFYFWSCSLKYLSLRIFWSFSFFHFYRNLYHGHFPLYHGQLPFVHFPIKVIFWSPPHSCFLKLRNKHFKLIQFLWSELRLNLFLAIVESTL